MTPEETIHGFRMHLSLSLSLSLLSHLVVANILPPTFSLAQSCLEQASGDGKVDVCRSTKSMGSASRHVGQRALSVLWLSGVDGWLDVWVECTECSEWESPSAVGESSDSLTCTSTAGGSQQQWHTIQHNSSDIQWHTIHIDFATVYTWLCESLLHTVEPLIKDSLLRTQYKKPLLRTRFLAPNYTFM